MKKLPNKYVFLDIRRLKSFYYEVSIFPAFVDAPYQNRKVWFLAALHISLLPKAIENYIELWINNSADQLKVRRISCAVFLTLQRHNILTTKFRSTCQVDFMVFELFKNYKNIFPAPNIYYLV